MTVTAVDKNTLITEVPKQPLALVDMWADWCMPCKRLAPIVEELSNELKNVKFYKVDVEAFPEIAQRYDVMNIPTMLILKKGQEVDRLVGLMAKDEIKKRLQSNL